jgi:hypothetical protein
MSLPRSINALRFSSAFGVFCSVYLCFAITIIFWANKNLVPDPIQNFKDAAYFKVSGGGFNRMCSLTLLALFHPSR